MTSRIRRLFIFIVIGVYYSANGRMCMEKSGKGEDKGEKKRVEVSRNEQVESEGSRLAKLELRRVEIFPVFGVTCGGLIAGAGGWSITPPIRSTSTIIWPGCCMLFLFHWLWDRNRQLFVAFKFFGSPDNCSWNLLFGDIIDHHGVQWESEPLNLLVRIEHGMEFNLYSCLFANVVLNQNFKRLNF